MNNIVKVRKDLTGQRFGKLVVIKQADDFILPSGIHEAQWLCKCDCGNDKIVESRYLRMGLIKSCGCITKENNFNRCTIDLTGRTFGRLTVIQYDHSKNGAYWLCRCECGKTKVIKGNSLTRGVTTSCGCKSREMSIGNWKKVPKNRNFFEILY